MKRFRQFLSILLVIAMIIPGIVNASNEIGRAHV